MRRLAAHPRQRSLASNLRILRRLSPADFKAVEFIVSDIVRLRLKRIDQTALWREAKRS